MTARLIDGRVVADAVNARTSERVRDLIARGGRPGLATVLVGDDPASAVYVASKRRTAAALGIADVHVRLRADADESVIVAAVDELAADPDVSGILLQLPLPAGPDGAHVIERIPPEKDVDGLTTASQGLLARGRPGLRPCTPRGIIELLQHAEVPLSGAHAVVIGRSELVGRPLAQLLLQQDATVTIAHSRTRDLAGITKQADIVVAAAGSPGLVAAGHVQGGAAVIDVGIHRTPTGLVGDVDFAEVREIAGWITPVPGGVGPMTIAMLMANTVDAAESALTTTAPRRTS